MWESAGVTEIPPRKIPDLFLSGCDTLMICFFLVVTPSCVCDLLCSLSGCQKVPGMMFYLGTRRRLWPLWRGLPQKMELQCPWENWWCPGRYVQVTEQSNWGGLWANHQCVVNFNVSGRKKKKFDHLGPFSTEEELISHLEVKSSFKMGI